MGGRVALGLDGTGVYFVVLVVVGVDIQANISGITEQIFSPQSHSVVLV